MKLNYLSTADRRQAKYMPQGYQEANAKYICQQKNNIAAQYEGRSKSFKAWATRIPHAYL